jgi:putative membrane protein
MLALMTTDGLLAILHHLLAFGMAGLLAAEIGMLRTGMTAAGLKRLGLVDMHYGLFAALIIVVGVLRVIHGIKGPDFYVASAMFWAKMAAFAVVAGLSIPPTVSIIRWRRKSRLEPAYCPFEEEVKRIRAWMVASAAVFALIPVFAALMARGVGLAG